MKNEYNKSKNYGINIKTLKSLREKLRRKGFNLVRVNEEERDNTIGYYCYILKRNSHYNKTTSSWYEVISKVDITSGFEELEQIVKDLYMNLKQNGEYNSEYNKACEEIEQILKDL